jgi:hypothetical protein
MTTTSVLIIILTIIAGLTVLFYFVHRMTLKSRKSEFKDWKVGDLLILKPISTEHYELNKLGRSMAKLLGWTESNLYLEIGDSVRQCSWDCFSDNKSAIWRRNYDNCKSAMGVDPGFKSTVSDSSSLSGKKVEGKPIELLSEVECEVYLKKAIEDEDYDLAELIRKRMEKFR